MPVKVFSFINNSLESYKELGLNCGVYRIMGQFSKSCWLSGSFISNAADCVKLVIMFSIISGNKVIICIFVLHYSCGFSIQD